MLHEFLVHNRIDLVARCRAKVARRQGPLVTDEQLENGIPIFLDQLIRTLRAEEQFSPADSLTISGPAGGFLSHSEIGTSAALHGKHLLMMGFTVDQVVHDYGDLCQAITDLAVERNAPFLVDEFRTLNRCLDNAIADAVAEFTYQHESLIGDKYTKDANERMGYFVHELRNLLGTATLAFRAAKTGSLGLQGATGSILERSLTGLTRLIDISLVDIRSISNQINPLHAFSLADFIGEVQAAAQLAARGRSCALVVPQVDPTLAISGNREALLAAVANLLQNAFKFTCPHTEVALRAFASSDRVIIEVQDHCGGLPEGSAETMFMPFFQSGKDRSGLGLGLTIAQQSVIANGGTLSVRDVPGVGCVFTINLPRFAIQA
jgi:signal transduction histidine kinase